MRCSSELIRARQTPANSYLVAAQSQLASLAGWRCEAGVAVSRAVLAGAGQTWKEARRHGAELSGAADVEPAPNWPSSRFIDPAAGRARPSTAPASRAHSSRPPLAALGSAEASLWARVAAEASGLPAQLASQGRRSKPVG